MIPQKNNIELAKNRTSGIFVTGTGTDVGKTYITALLIKALHSLGIRAGYFKAALSGAEFNGREWIAGDAKYVCDIAGLSAVPNTLVSYIFKTAASPHLAARIENNPIELELIQKRFNELSRSYDFMVVEGSGGIVCPLRLDEKSIMLKDIIQTLDLQVIVVSDSGLGTINSTVLTLEYAKTQDIHVVGVIFNRFETGNPIHQDNIKTIQKLTGISVITCVPRNADQINTEDLRKAVIR